MSNVDGIKNKKFVYNREEYLTKLNDHIKGCIEFVSLQDLKDQSILVVGTKSSQKSAMIMD